MEKHTHTLSDGRILSYAFYGPASGYPVVYFHGTPSSCLELLLLREYGTDIEKLLRKTGLRIIAIDRPGMGGSDFDDDASFTSFAHDVKQLLQHLHISACHALCWSGGGPFCLMTAYLYPSLVQSVHILCGFTRPLTPNVMRKMGPNKWYFRMSRYFGSALRWTLSLLRSKEIRKPLPQWMTGLPDVDYHFIREPSNLNALSALTVKEACRQGTEGPVHEAALYLKPFGFELSDIVQTVHYWWGTEDNSVVRHHAEAAEKDLPYPVMHYKKGEGHLSLYIRCFTEALQTIADSTPLQNQELDLSNSGSGA